MTVRDDLIVRVISGRAGGLLLKSPEGNETRPTSDKVKEALFSIIADYIEDSIVLDLFAGTGGLGIEALSRGAAKAVFNDPDPLCRGIIAENLKHTGFSEKSEVFGKDALKLLLYLSNKKDSFDMIFLDPPYLKKLINPTLKVIVDNGIIKSTGLIIAEHSSCDEIPPPVESSLVITKRKIYGVTTITLFSMTTK